MDSNSDKQGGSATTITAVHQNIIETHILTRFDGPALASTASTSHLLHTLCNQDELWEDLCNSTWNSIKDPLVRQIISTFSGGYRSFFSDSFPLLRPNPSEGSYIGQVHNSELISAVDMYYGNDPVYSNVKATDTSDSNFLGLQFCIDLLDGEGTSKMPIKYEGDEKKCILDFEEKLRLSWIIIDPKLKRAANVSSLRPISVRPCWVDGSGIKVKYATIVSGDNRGIYTTEFVECRVTAIFRFEGKNIKLKELSLCVVDMDWTRLNGEKSLRILKEALHNGLRKKATGGEEKEMYAKFVDLKRKKRDEVKKENIVDRFMDFLWRFSNPFAEE
ncbi:F-box protein At2g27310 [Daucus carota subsp. sativus]|uniref:F-box domain-containing protein n=1 Tax=Daucus carota subsp. sativus TaxID=79200 RepID=A0A166C9C2_DAUCS|nr:PREDICTED: F-box protein At2g27310-like [Daucus carota subsp. sativus]